MYKFFFLALLILISSSVLAKKAPNDEDAVICVGGPRWSPTIEDSKDIRVSPVPMSYRSIFEPLARCASWKEYAPQMIDWQIRFGDVQTTTTALKYIEQLQSSGHTDLSNFPEKLIKSYGSARTDIVRASKIKQPSGVNYNARYRYLQSQKSVKRFEQLQRDRRDFQFLTGLYVKAAEEFADKSLLKRAEQFLEPAFEGAKFLESIENTPPIKGQYHFNLDVYELDDFRARIALTRLQISQSLENLEAARAALLSDNTDHYVRLAETAFSDGDSFCDIADRWSNSEALAVECRNEDEVHEQVVNQMVNRAVFGLYYQGSKFADHGNKSNDSDWRSYYNLAMRLLSFEEVPDFQSRCCGNRVEEDRIRLGVARAISVESEIQSYDGKSKLSILESNWYDTLNSLRKAQQLVPAYSAPARFRRIARKWLKLEKLGMLLFNKGDDKVKLSNEMIRYKIYLQNMAGDKY